MTSFSLSGQVTEASSAAEITKAHFQSVLVNKYVFQDSEDRLEQGTVFDEGVDTLGISSIRFPGGTEAWDGSFDFRNPDDVARLYAVIDYCASQNITLQFTVPVRWFLSSDLDSTGQRTVQISDSDAAALASFIEEDLMGYAASVGVTVENIKLGNEFLASADGTSVGMDLSSISPEEYGAAASAVAIIVGEALESFSSNNSLSGFYNQPDIVLEMPNWTGGIDRMLASFDTNAIEYIGAVDTHAPHSSLEASMDELLGTNASSTTWYDNDSVAERLEILISYMEEASSEYGFGELNYLNEAWAVEEAGLDHLTQAILTFHSMSLSGVESATLWTAFSGGDYTTKSAAFTDNNDGRVRLLGELMIQMQSHVTGMKAVELDTGMSGAEELEQDYIVRAFVDEQGRAVIYVMNHQSDEDQIDLDLTEFLSSVSGFSSGLDDIEVVKFGAAKGAYNSFYKSSDMEKYGSEILGVDPIVDGITLGAYEVLQITVTSNGEFATDGDDTIIVDGDESAWIFGYAGDDVIETGSGADIIDAGAGNDVIDAGGGSDFIVAGEGDDIVTGGYGMDEVYLGDGDDTFYDEINQTNVWGNDFVDAGDGNDTIFGGGGDDTFYGGNGNDYIEGGTGNDTIQGDSGNDTIYGGNGSDYILGGEGNDTIDGGAHADTILAGDGDDVVVGGFGKDIVYLGDGNDVFLDHAQKGGYGQDIVHGGAGDDEIHLGGGDDIASGGEGADVFIFSGVIEDDRITDFVIDEGDLIDLSAYNFSGMSDLTIGQDAYGNAQVVLDGYGTVTFDNLTMGDISADMFLF